MSKIVQRHCGTRFSHCSSHCKTVNNSFYLSEGETVTKGAGLTDRSIVQLTKHLSEKNTFNRQNFYKSSFESYVLKSRPM